MLQKCDENYIEQQKSWRDEIQENLKSCKTNGREIHKYEQDLILKRQDELKNIRDIRHVYQRKLERTNNLYLELSACFMHLEEREKEVAERESKFSQRPYKKIVSQLRKQHFDKFSRRRFCMQSLASFEVNSTSPSPPASTPTANDNDSNMNKSQIYAQLAGNQTKSIIVQPIGGSAKAKKFRHRRVGSGGGGSFHASRSSPHRDRRSIQSEPEHQGGKIDQETQTEELPATIKLPEGVELTTTMRHVQMCLNENQIVSVMPLKPASPGNDENSNESDIDDNMPQNEDTTSSSQTNNNIHMANSMATSAAMTESNFSFDNSSDQFNIIRECSDDDNLDDISRKVSLLITETTSATNSSSNVSSCATIINKNYQYNENNNFNQGSATINGESMDDGPASEDDDAGSSANQLRRKSACRLPVRPRRLRQQKFANNEIKLVSDEENNTSEYSSSKHSTLNTKIPPSFSSDDENNNIN